MKLTGLAENASWRTRGASKSLVILVVMCITGAVVWTHSSASGWNENEQGLSVHSQLKIAESARFCARRLGKRVDALNSEEKMKSAMAELKEHAVVVGVDGDQKSLSSLAESLRGKHKIAHVGDKLLFLFNDNLVVTADASTCEVTGMYAGRDGQLHPHVKASALSANLVAVDKGAPPPPPAPKPTTRPLPVYGHDVVSPWYGPAAGHHWNWNPATPKSPGIAVIATWSSNVVHALEIRDANGAKIGPFGRARGTAWSYDTRPTGSCFTEVQLRSGRHISGIRFRVKGPQVDLWTPWQGGHHGQFHHFASGGSCLKGIGVFGDNFAVNRLLFVFGFWCPAGWDCTQGYAFRKPCAPGFYATQGKYNRKGCVGASKGHFVPRAGMTKQEICLPGTTQAKTGQSACVDAPAGHYAMYPGWWVPQPCKAPHYQPKTRQLTCLKASPGYYVATDGSASQTPCPAGSYQPNGGSKHCLKCGAGTFQGQTGQTTCLKAMPGHYVSGIGATKETACSPGTFQSGVGQTQCIKASPGHVVGGSGWPMQKACAAGYVQPRAGQRSCIKDPKYVAPKTTKRAAAVLIPGKSAITGILGAETMDSGYNLFRGVGATPEIARRLGYFTNELKRSVRVDGGAVFLIPDQMEFVSNPGCRSSQQSNEYYQSYSVKQSVAVASRFSISSSTSGMAGHACPPLWSLGVAASTSVFYGNSAEMRQSQQQAAQGFAYASDSFIDATLYNLHVDWKKPNVAFSFDAPFRTLISSINYVGKPSKALNRLVMNLVETYGSHVITDGTFGSQCSMTMYMESSASQSSVSQFLSSSWNVEVSKEIFAWFMSPVAQAAAHSKTNVKASGSKSSAFSGTFANGRKYSVKNVQCSGYVKDNLCDVSWNAKNDNPAMVEFLPLPIWEVEGAGWTPQGQRNVLWVLRDFERALLRCNRAQCGNVGVCTMKASFWDSMVATMSWDGDFFSKQVENYGNSIMWNSGCVCEYGMDSATNKCSQPGYVPVLSAPAETPAYEWVRAYRLGCAEACKLGKYGYPPVYAHKGPGKDGICSTGINGVYYVGSNFDIGSGKPQTHQCVVNWVVAGQAPRDIVHDRNYFCLCGDETRLVRQSTYEEPCYVMCPRVGRNPVTAMGYKMDGTQTDLCIAMEPKWNLRGGYTAHNKCTIWHNVFAKSFQCLCY